LAGPAVVGFILTASVGFTLAAVCFIAYLSGIFNISTIRAELLLLEHGVVVSLRASLLLIILDIIRGILCLFF